MDWLFWVWVPVIVASIYFLGLVIYKLFLSGKALQSEILKAQAQVESTLSGVTAEITPAMAASEAELVELVKARRQLLQGIEAQKQKRQRRLVARLRDIEIDKRFL
jgi:hypothetical protein